MPSARMYYTQRSNLVCSATLRITPRLRRAAPATPQIYRLLHIIDLSADYIDLTLFSAAAASFVFYVELLRAPESA